MQFCEGFQVLPRCSTVAGKSAAGQGEGKHPTGPSALSPIGLEADIHVRMPMDARNASLPDSVEGRAVAGSGEMAGPKDSGP